MNIGTLKKPTLAAVKAKSAAALAFAESGSKFKQEAANKRAFYAPEGHRRLTINLPEALHKKLKLAAIEQDCTATDIIERMLEKAL